MGEPATSDEQDAVAYCHLGGVTNFVVAQGHACTFTRPLSTVWDAPSDDTAAALAEEIRVSIEFYMSQEGARPVSQILLSGPGAASQALTDELAALVTVPVSVTDPLGRLVDALPAEEDPSLYTVAAGLALGEAA